MNTGSSTSNHEANQEFFDHHQINPWPTQNIASPIFTSSLPPLHPNMPIMINHPFYNGGWNIDHHLGLASFYNPMQFGSFNGDQMPKMMSAEEVMDAKALAASKSHSEAERRRRERINVHLARLRSLLPNTTKTDKASLLAEVIQHVKELRRQTSEISEESPLPTESDELIVQSLNTNEDTINNDQKFIAKALLCCDDRPNLLPDLIKALKTLHLKTLKAEITTLGGRVRSVLVICGDEDFDCSRTDVSSIQDALKVVMERSSGFESELNGTKRQRVATNLFDHDSI